jgi:DNA-binding NtrC family response regulator
MPETQTEFASEFETVKRPKFERPKSVRAFEIRVVSGPDLGVSVTLDASNLSSLLLGQSALCGIRLTDPSVCARHCSLQIVGSTLRLVDLSEPRATKVNGTQVFEAMLMGGETLRIGDTVLSVSRVEVRRDGSRATCFGRVRGESNAMRDVYPQLESATRSLEPVLLQGERGTGKRLVAEELHRLTRRAGEPGFFVAVPVFDTADELLAALFGQGGLFEQARGGTLYLSEVTALDEAIQDALAREIATNAGAEDAGRVRVIVGTRTTGSVSLSPALAREFRAGTGHRVTLPALRAREADVVALARHFWTELGGEESLPDDFAMHFQGHAWPGNVRELRVVVQGWIQHGDRTPGRPEVVAAPQRANDALSRLLESDLPFARARKEIVAEFEKRYISRALKRADFKIGRAAAASGIAHRYFQVLKSRALPTP